MKAFELGERIESARFLGREFLVFVWWLSEIGEGEVSVPKHGVVSLHLDATLVLERKAEGLESCRLRGAAPSAGKEAKEALRDGKMPTRAHVQLAKSEQAFAFSLNADTLATSGVKIPALLTERDDETFFERMQLVEELESVLDELYADFVGLRISSTWDATIAPELRRWVREQGTMDRSAYEALRDAMVERTRPRR